MLNFSQYSDDQLDYLDELCRYRRLNPPKTNYSAKVWLISAPELENTFKRLLNEKENELEITEQYIVDKFNHYSKFPMPYSLIGTELISLVQGDKVIKLQKEIRWFKSGFITITNKDELSEEQIETARQFPMAELMTTPGHRGSYSCPFHDDSTPSFHIFPNNSWHCFGCQKHGQNAVDYIMAKDDLTFPNAVKSLIGG